MTEFGRNLARSLGTRDASRSALLVAGLLAAAALVAYWLLGATGVLIAATLVVSSALVSGSGEWLLRLQRARRLSHANAPTILYMVERLSARANVDVPHVMWLPTAVPNALTTETRDGRGAIAISEGLLRRLDDAELQAVIAHEISHLKHRDTRLTRWTTAASSTAITLLRVSVWFGLAMMLLSGEGFGTWIVLVLVSWFVPMLFVMLQSALSRTREFAADTRAVQLTGQPLALASALEKLERSTSPWLYVVLGRRRQTGWLDSHPATPERVDRLRAMARAPHQRSTEVQSPWPQFTTSAKRDPNTWRIVLPS